MIKSIKPSIILEKGRAGSKTPRMDKEKKGREREGVVMKKIGGKKKGRKYKVILLMKNSVKLPGIWSWFFVCVMDSRKIPVRASAATVGR